MSSLEDLRNKNIADNKRILLEIGLVNPFKGVPRVSLKKGVKRKNSFNDSSRAKRPLLEENVDHSSHGSIRGVRRKSARIQGKPCPTTDELREELEDNDGEEDTSKKTKVFRPNTYGAIEGVEVGMSWLTRMECSRDRIHRPTVAGIHGGPEGAYSIALSGGYDDNVDLGEGFTYTGEGGRDLKGTKSNPKNLRTAPQSKDQTLTRGNLALSKSVETGKPVRVIRGYKLNTAFAPEEGYRYDGLYTVEKAWYTTGLAGFGVWKFALRRCQNQAPPPWTLLETDLKSPKKDGNNNSTSESPVKVSPDVKDTAVRDGVKDSSETQPHPSMSTDSDSGSDKENEMKPMPEDNDSRKEEDSSWKTEMEYKKEKTTDLGNDDEKENM